MKAAVADQMNSWIKQGKQMQWATFGVSQVEGPLAAYADPKSSAAMPMPANDSVYNCFEAIFLAALHAGQLDKAGLDKIYGSIVRGNEKTPSIFGGPSQTFRRGGTFSSERVPQKGDLVVFGDNLEHVTLAMGSGASISGPDNRGETAILSFWAQHETGPTPARIVTTTIEAMQKLLDSFKVPSKTTFGPPLWD